MSTTSYNSPRHDQETAQEAAAETRAAQAPKSHLWLGWSSFLFALLQSICTFFAATNGLRLAIGVGSLVASSSVAATLQWSHSDIIRLPMIGLALVGSLLNLVVIWQIRRLRARPSASWRQRPVSAGKIRMERLQIVLSILTLILISVEEYWHLTWHHHV